MILCLMFKEITTALQSTKPLIQGTNLQEDIDKILFRANKSDFEKLYDLALNHHTEIKGYYYFADKKSVSIRTNNPIEIIEEAAEMGIRGAKIERDKVVWPWVKYQD